MVIITKMEETEDPVAVQVEIHIPVALLVPVIKDMMERIL